MIYIDNGATSFPKPAEVYDFMNDFYRQRGVSPGRGSYKAAIQNDDLVSETRRLMTRLLNGGTDENHLTFSYNASDSLNMLIQGIAGKGMHVITTLLEHNSVLRPLYALQQKGIIEVTFLPFDKRGYVDPDDFKKAIQANTRMAVCTHCSNVLGTVQPLKEIGTICKENGIIFIVDGSQAAGAVKVDMVGCGVDAYAFTGHKSLLGPTGIGGSYVCENVTVRHTRYGGTGARSDEPYHLDEYPYRLETGTINILGVGGLNAGVKWLMNQGIENIHAREMKLWRKLLNGLENIERVTIYCAASTENHNPILSFNIRGFAPAEVGKKLDKDYDIACRTGLQCAPKVHERLGTLGMGGTVRFSIGAFNTETDIEACISAVKEIAALKN